jgi:RNA-directed DNA polymerase
MGDKRQKNQLELVFAKESRSEAPRPSAAATESPKRGAKSPAIGDQLMEEVGERDNGKRAMARVKANKGSAGVDAMSI